MTDQGFQREKNTRSEKIKKYATLQHVKGLEIGTGASEEA